MTTPVAFFEEFAVAANQPYGGSIPRGSLLPNGDLLVVFEGTAGHTPVYASRSTDDGATWSDPEVLAPTGMQANLTVTGGRVILHYLEHRHNSDSTIWQRLSDDGGAAWSDAVRIDTGHPYSFTTNNGIALGDGTLICPYSWERRAEAVADPGRAQSEMDAVSSVLRSTDNGESWEPGGDVHLSYDETDKADPQAIYGVDEPAVIQLSSGDVYMLCRTGLSHLYQAISADRGRTWSTPEAAPLCGCDAPAALARLDSGATDVAWNNSSSSARLPLDVAISYDDCRTWAYSLTLMGHLACYPGLTTTRAGDLVAFWHDQSFQDEHVAGVHPGLHCGRFSEEWVRRGGCFQPTARR